MAEESFQEKTEKATPQKRKEAREKGEVAKSRELPSVMVLAAALVSLAVYGRFMFGRLKEMMHGTWTFVGARKDFNPVEFVSFGHQVIFDFILIILPMLVSIALVAIVSNILQVGLLFSAESLMPKLSKLDPVKGFGRLFSKNSLMELAKTIFKITVVGSVAYISIKGEMADLSFLGTMEMPAIAGYTMTTIFKIFMKCTLAMLLIVVIDVAFQKWDFEKRMRMSKQEVKEEHKKSEGDPQIKSRIRSIQLQIARKRMMQDVPKADVIVTNPTHLAVALSYSRLRMNAPKVLAKGAGVVAQRIKDTAKSHGIPVVENKPLAQSLYRTVEIGEEIPGDLYQAVAEVLAYIYRIKGKIAGDPLRS